MTIYEKKLLQKYMNGYKPGNASQVVKKAVKQVKENNQRYLYHGTDIEISGVLDQRIAPKIIINPKTKKPLINKYGLALAYLVMDNRNGNDILILQSLSLKKLNKAVESLKKITGNEITLTVSWIDMMGNIDVDLDSNGICEDISLDGYNTLYTNNKHIVTIDSYSDKDDEKLLKNYLNHNISNRYKPTSNSATSIAEKEIRNEEKHQKAKGNVTITGTLSNKIKPQVLLSNKLKVHDADSPSGIKYTRKKLQDKHGKYVGVLGLKRKGNPSQYIMLLWREKKLPKLSSKIGRIKNQLGKHVKVTVSSVSGGGEINIQKIKVIK